MKLTFGTAERVAPLWAAQVLELRDPASTPMRYTVREGSDWKLCRSISQAEYEQAKRKPPTADELFFWQVELDLKFDPNDPQRNPPVMFAGRSVNGNTLAWTYDRVKGVGPVDPPEWLDQVIQQLERRP
jgi:hypothetical protein